jgi:SAM-dependent methyltransferase
VQQRLAIPLNWAAAMKSTLKRAYFDDMYGKSSDPWNFESSPYEREKYAATLAALPRPRYDYAFEIGCSGGVFTHSLAARCGQLLSVDISEKAVAQARSRCQDMINVRFQQMEVPFDYPEFNFDLTILAEVGYYWSPQDLGIGATKVTRQLKSGGHLVLVHWTPFAPDHPLMGDEVHEFFLKRPELGHMLGYRGEKYRLDLFERRS